MQLLATIHEQYSQLRRWLATAFGSYRQQIRHQICTFPKCFLTREFALFCLHLVGLQPTVCWPCRLAWSSSSCSLAIFVIISLSSLCGTMPKCFEGFSLLVRSERLLSGKPANCRTIIRKRCEFRTTKANLIIGFDKTSYKTISKIL